MTRDEKLSRIEELRNKAFSLKKEMDYYNALQLALKLCLNGSYGAFAAAYFVMHHPSVSSSITSQGRDLTKTMDAVNQHYWYKMWHDDLELHKKLCIRDVKKVKKSEHVSIYADTDSISSESMITTDKQTLTIEDWYNNNIENGSAGITLSGHESVLTKDKILNWNNDLYFADVKRIIRHKVTKTKWKLKTKSGKEIIVTNDHSMIVFRNDEKLTIRPSEILKTDKILTVE